MTRRRGFTLTEMLLAISLLGVFMLLAFRLVHANFHIMAETLAGNSNMARFDNAVNALRADVSNAASIEMPGPSLLRIYGPENQVIEWRNDHATLSRTAAKQSRTWDVGQPLDLKLDGAVVLIWANPSDQLAMAPLLIGGRR